VCVCGGRGLSGSVHGDIPGTELHKHFLLVACVGCSVLLVAMCYVLPVLWITLYLHTISHMASRVYANSCIWTKAHYKILN